MDFATGINRDNPYLQGSFGPIDQEGEHEKLEVIGKVPRDLNGVYARIGPNPRYSPRGRHHWFDGDGMIHAAAFEDGEVTYRNRYVATAALAQEEEAGRSLWSGLLEGVGGNPAGTPYKDTANTDLTIFNGELIALWYICGTPHRVDPATLQTLGTCDWGSKHGRRVSAHAKADAVTRDLMFFDYGPKSPYMTYGVISENGGPAHHTEIDLPGPRLPHDMAITSNYSILMDLPLFQTASVHGRWSVDFHRELSSRFCVIPRRGTSTDIRWFEASPCYIYHTVNAWEEGDAIVMVGCRTSEPLPAPRKSDGEWAGMMANLRVDAHLHRWRFDLRTGQTTEEPLDDRRSEFPMINAELLGQKNRYSYHQTMAPTPTLRFDGILKYDLATGHNEHYAYGPGRYGSESPFAPRDGASAEDEGYLLSFVHDENTQQSELVIKDASNMAAPSVARVLIPHRVPLGFHSCWVPRNSSRKDA